MKVPLILFAVVLANVGACSVGCEFPSRQLEPPAGSYEASTMTLNADGKEESIKVARVSRDFFDGPKVTPLLGRFFVPEEYRGGGTSVGVLSHEYWSGRFASTPGIIGQQIQLDGRAVVIVGIGPKNFGPADAPVWVPPRNDHRLSVQGASENYSPRLLIPSLAICRLRWLKNGPESSEIRAAPWHAS